MARMGKVPMRKMQKSSPGKRKATRPHSARSGHKKGIRRLGQVLRETVHRLLGLQGPMFRVPRKQDKKGKHITKEV
jgi:hypothetical protein